jgi:hypothetical protein
MLNPIPQNLQQYNSNIMASKKYSFLLGLITLMLSTTVCAQTNVWSDSSYYQSGKLPQYNEFMNNLYAYPPKPRNMWEVGVKVGAPTISGDVNSIFPTFGWGVHVRKSLGYMLSVRAEYINGTAKGLNWQEAQNYMKNPAWAVNQTLGANGYHGNQVTASGDRVPATDNVFYNYKAKVNDLGLQAIFNFSNIKFHSSQTKIGLYLIAGVGVTWYDTHVNALNGSANYSTQFNGISNINYDNRKEIRKQLKSILDDSYETPAQNNDARQGKKKFSGTLGGGVSWRLSRRLNIALEDRLTFVKDDLIDGQQWTEHPFGDATFTRNFDSINFLSLGLNINIF